MISVQNRPVPATCQGCAAHAARSRAAALARSGVRPTPVPKRAKPRASADSGIAQVGTEQPSTAQTSCDEHRAGQAFERGLDQTLHRIRPARCNARDRRRARRRRRESPRACPSSCCGARRPCRRRAPAHAPTADGSASARRISARPRRARRALSIRVRGRDVAGLARMRGAGQRQFLSAEAIAFGSAGLHQRQAPAAPSPPSADRPAARRRPAPAPAGPRHRPRRPRRNAGFPPARRAAPRPGSDYSLFMWRP